MKTIFYLAYTIILLSSCSQDDNLTESSSVEKLYSVTFNIESESFKVDVDSIKSTKTIINDFYGKYFLQYIVYKESGEIYSNKITGADSWAKIVNDGKAQITDSLPKGNYHISILSAKCSNQEIPSYYYIKPANYNYDYFTPNSSPSSAIYNNSDAYYQTFDLSVGQENNNISVELQPTWSYISLNMKDLKNINIPEGTTIVIIYANPHLLGFSIKDIKAKGYTVGENDFPFSGKFAEMTLDNFLHNDSINSRIYTAASNTPVSIEIKFISTSHTEQIIGTTKFGSFNIKDNNKNYKVTIKPNPNSYEVGFGVSINDFIGEDVEVTLN